MIAGGAFLYGLPGVIWGAVVAQAAACVLTAHAIHGRARAYRMPISYSSCIREMPVLWQFSIPAVLAQLLISVVSWVGSAMLVRQPNGYGEMGIFSAANQWFNALLWIPSMLNSVVLPMFAERLGAGDRNNTLKLLKASLTLNALVLVPMIVLGGLFSPYIMTSYGQAFSTGWPTLVAVLATAGLLGFNLPVGQLISASGRMWFAFLLNVGWATVFLGVTALLLSRGAFGFASARFLAYFSQTALSLAYVLFILRDPKRSARSEVVIVLEKA
jgi:O-antigen/teichoic acid export membrane protein